LQAVILAAGESSRFWPLNGKHKSLLRVMGKPLIWHTINGLRQVGVDEIIIVQSPKREIEEELKSFPEIKNISYAIQPEANGMSGAMVAARDHIKGQFFVVFAHAVDCGDVCAQMMEKSRQTGAKMVLAGQVTENPWLYGIVGLQDDKILGMVEKPAEGKEPSNIKVKGTYLLDDKYFDYLDKVLGKVHFNQEFEAAIDAYAKDNDARIVLLEKDYQGVSLKYPWHLFGAQKYIFDKFLTQQKIAKSAQIAKNATIAGNVIIGENVKIYEGAAIKGPCYIGDNSVIGNNSVARDYCDLENGAMVGAFCEAARCIFQPDVHIHSGYFGDSIFDRGVRMGAGAITTNVRVDRGEIFVLAKKEQNGVKNITKINTKLKSFGVIIGQNSKIGARATFMPGRFIGKNCQIGPNQLIMRNVDDDAKI